MAEHDAERAGSEEGREPLPAEGTAVPEDGTGTGAGTGTGPQDAAAARTAPPGGDEGDEGDGSDRSVDEKAAWEAIVAGYGEE